MSQPDRRDAASRCPVCGLLFKGEHPANTMCPFGLDAAIRAGFITADEAARRLIAGAGVEYVG